MKKLSVLTFGVVASLAFAGTGCDAIKKMVGPRMEQPSIGTRSSAIASLDVKKETKKAKFLGCDLKYFNMPAGSKIRLKWHHYADADGKIEEDDEAEQSTAGKEQSVQGTGVINAYLSVTNGEFAPGVYECEWKAITDKKVEGEEQHARIQVGDLSEIEEETKKAKDKKSKKKKSDDDE